MMSKRSEYDALAVKIGSWEVVSHKGRVIQAINLPQPGGSAEPEVRIHVQSAQPPHQPR